MAFTSLSYHLIRVHRTALFLRPFEPTRNEAELFDFNGPHALNEWGLGCDQDIGGHSTARLQLTPENKGMPRRAMMMQR